ncbi:polysaccharide lyase family 7 protein [Pseudomonas sp. Marseille-Q5115]|uniref:polysaccharide lyase family 7 protein n=1 Tax=Pseudomonas sp. Marseille-Q5115 TaxID=2866593 RepID=UPI001CE46371|nr:polysaccharide lyase family 7 protein [Pseudomonas sp. Marseille-Q5115]
MIDLSVWDLILPVGTPAQEVAAARLSTFSNPYFQNTGGTLVFWAPVTGAQSGSSHYPRSEMREVNKSGSQRNWKWNSGTNAISGKVAVTQVPSEGKVIVAQIHAKDADSPLLKLQYRFAKGVGNVDITWRTKPGDDKSPIIYTFKNVPLGQPFTYNIQMANTGVLTATVNGVVTKVTLDSKWKPYSFFFKAGNYTLDHSGYTTEGGRVTYYELQTKH